MEITKHRSADAVLEPVLDFKTSMDHFQSQWLHCDQIANYIAVMMGHNRADPIRYSNVLSMALNEILEMCFRAGRAEGSFHCRILRGKRCDRMEITFGCGPEQQEAYIGIVSGLSAAKARLDYLSAIETEAIPAPGTSLTGLVLNYDADIGLQAGSADEVTIVVDFPLEGMLN